MSAPVWTISQLERIPYTGGVIRAHWVAELRNGRFRESATGFVDWTPDPHNPSFIPFEDLKHNQVLSWVINTLGVDRVVAVDEMLVDRIQAKMYPDRILGLPWK